MITEKTNDITYHDRSKQFYQFNRKFTLGAQRNGIKFINAMYRGQMETGGIPMVAIVTWKWKGPEQLITVGY